MSYICAAEFLKQPEKVQKVLKDWMKDKYSKGDLVATHHGLIEVVIILESFSDENGRKGYYCITQHEKTPMWIAEYPNWLTPLFTETQLRKFIEDRGYKYIEVNNFLECDGKQWNIKVLKSLMQFEPDMEFYCDTPLECYWAVATYIAGEE